jgi:1-deoxy-D-xylulose-5-phosphate reductoisomerase
MKKGLAILGSTGSIGTQALEVLEENQDKFELQVLTANKNADLLINQAKKHQPQCVVIVDESQYQKVKDALWDEGILVYTGYESLSQVVQMSEVEVVLTALVGFSGLQPTMSAIEAGKNIALANKETLVVAGDLVTEAARKKGVNIYPVDSEHSAIFQCLSGEFDNPIEKLILTASGGPFRGKKRNQLAGVTKELALKHPNWEMGAKITIDSATLMNKGLEVIEAYWLFAVKSNQIEVVVHPESIIHSAVQFQDGSIKAQMGLPDMKLPIQYALGYPNRIKNEFPRFSFFDYPELHFDKPDVETFRNLKLAFNCLNEGGNAACVLNAANEITVDAFLKDRINFLQIAEINEKALQHFPNTKFNDIESYVELDKEVRAWTSNQSN